MPLTLDIQRAFKNLESPSDDEMAQWLSHCLQAQGSAEKDVEISLRIVETDEIQALNLQYRGKDKPTNVLSFPTDFPEELAIPLLGDIVICAKILVDEACEQNKPLKAHWAHILIHGLLHLQGHDHINDTDAQIMESLECEYMQQLGFNNPYENEESPS